MRPARLSSVLIFSIAILAIPMFATAASMKFSPASGSHAVGKTFTITVTTDSGTDTFNSASAAISFDKEFLSVQSVSKNGSALSLWAVEPSSNNGNGTVSFEGGNTTPLTGQRSLLTVTFKALKVGTAAVTITSGSVLAADGKGTDILTERGTASYTITAAETAPPPPPPSDTSQGGNLNIPLPDAPVITSPTHPEEGKWYNLGKAKFVWDLPVDVSVVRLSLDRASNTVPATSYDPAIVDKEFDTLDEGVLWFHLRYKNDAGWGPTGHRKIMVDNTPPPSFTLEAVDPKEEGGQVTLKFMATDTLSGIDRYEIVVDASAPLKVQPGDAKESGYILRDQSPGEHTVSVKAFDKAGNFAEAQSKFLIPGVVKTVGKGGAEDEEEKPTDWKLIWIIILVSLATFLFGYIVFEKKAFRHEKYITKRESDEVRDTVGNIFAALREEVGEQTGQLFQRPNPSAQDREVMMRINEAIDLSEELIAKEVEDVRKLLM
jgi:hypothetical protein